MPAHHQYIEIKIFGESKQVGKKEERKNGINHEIMKRMH